MKVKALVNIFYDEEFGGLIKGEKGWGSNPARSLYIRKGQIGTSLEPVPKGEENDVEFEFKNSKGEIVAETTLPNLKWFKILER